MKMSRMFGLQRSMYVPYLAAGLGIGLAIYTVVFGVWTATSPWALPRFLVATVVILYFPFPISGKPVPEFYRTLSTDSKKYGILDVGPVWKHWGMYHQITHRHPIVRGHSYRFPVEAKLYLGFMDQLVQPEPDITNREKGYAVLHKAYPNTVEAFMPSSSQLMGSPLYEDE